MRPSTISKNACTIHDWQPRRLLLLALVAILMGAFDAGMALGADEPSDSPPPASAPQAPSRYWFNVHGGLIVVAWVGLMPLGRMIAEHKWLTGDTPLWGRPRWWWFRAFFSLSAVSLLIAGFAISYDKFKHHDKSKLAEVHADLGIAVLVLSIVHGVLVNRRRNQVQEKQRRWLVRFILDNLGPASLLLAWSNIYVGIVTYHRDFGEKYAPWIAPCAVVMALLAVMELTLWLKRRSHGDAAPDSGDQDGRRTSFIDMEAVNRKADARPNAHGQQQGVARPQ